MLLLMLGLLLGAVTAASPASPPLRLAGQVFGAQVEVEVRDLPKEAARAAIEAAFQEMAEVERLLAPDVPAGGLTLLNAAAGQGPRPVEPRLLAALTRALDFCLWSEGAYGPLGRDLNIVWGLRSGGAATPPAPERLGPASALTACARLRLDPKKGTAELAEGSGLDLWGFAEGFAVDRAVEILRGRGVKNALVTAGMVRRGLGPGPSGKGWPVQLPVSLDGATNRIFLRDRAFALASSTERPLPFVNQRTGQLASGAAAILTVTELGVDAQALAAALAILGPREGRLRLGSLRPQPSVLWMMGTGSGEPLIVGHHWSEVTSPRSP
jgi:thiamine biosynthesis lipoprotein